MDLHRGLLHERHHPAESDRSVPRANGIPVYERNYSLVDTYGADEAFLTGTFGAQTPVGSIDGRQIGDGQMGAMTERIRGLYKALIEKECA